MAHFDLPTSVSDMVTEEISTLERFVFTTASSESDLKEGCQGSESPCVALYLEHLVNLARSTVIDAIGQGGLPGTWAVSREDQKAVAALILWRSVQEHTEYKKTEAFQKALPALQKCVARDPNMLHFKLESLKPKKQGGSDHILVSGELD